MMYVFSSRIVCFLIYAKYCTMRFFEFSRSQPGNITIPQILDIVKDPSADPALKKDITNALQLLVSKKRAILPTTT